MQDTRLAPGEEPGEDEIRLLEQRVGPVHVRVRLGMERDLALKPQRHRLNLLHLESFTSHPALVARVLRLTGLYGRGRRNTAQVRLMHNTVALPALPPALDGYTVLHMSDLHVDMNEPAMARVAEMVRALSYDLCVLTGDFRGPTTGPHAACIDGMARLRAAISAPVYGVLGDHDTIRMVPALEELGIAMLMNEHATIAHAGARLHLAGVDDARFYRVDELAKAAAGLPPGEPAILLSHTPEIYQQAAHAGFDLMLSGHTHGGQICLPGGFPLTLDAPLPRRMGAGAWRYRAMAGYTSVGAGSSVVPVRYNCPPEITLHRLSRAA